MLWVILSIVLSMYTGHFPSSLFSYRHIPFASYTGLKEFFWIHLYIIHTRVFSVQVIFIMLFVLGVLQGGFSDANKVTLCLDIVKKDSEGRYT